MRDFIYFLVIGGLFVANVMWAYKRRKQNNIAYKIVFLSRPEDWFWAIVLILGVGVSVAVIEPFIPDLLRFSVFSLIGKDGVNANVEIINESAKLGSSVAPVVSRIIVFAILFFLVLFIPKAAYWEEGKFRHRVIKFNRQCIVKNIKFGLLHCLVGVPLWVGILLIFVGMVFAARYIRTYRKTLSEDIALVSCTSLHGKYNLIIIVLLTLIVVYG